jgi:hypothetical protein
MDGGAAETRMTKPKADPATLVLFLGDLHVGSTSGLAPAAEVRGDGQRWLLATWQAFTARALAAAKGRALCLMLGGDLIDGLHHNSRETWGSRKDQRDAAVALLLPLANRASAIYALTGTEAHAGDKGEDDAQVGQELGAKTAAHVWRLTVGGRRLFWSHHGTSVPRDVSNEDNGLWADARRHYELSLRGGEKPDLIVHHHNHFSPDPVTRHGITAAVCPCWQLSTMYGARIGPERTPHIGALVWEPETNRLERWLYAQEARYSPLAHH